MASFFKKNRSLTIIFLAALVISTVIKILSVWGYNFPFTYDQGRDLVDLRQMLVTHTPRLVGPTTSINGVLLGPFYYYFIFLPFLIFGGSPQAIVFWQIAWFQIAVIALWLVIRKKDQAKADITGIFLLLLPTGFYTARYFWNANAMPIFTILFVAALFFCLEQRSKGSSFLLGLVTGLSMQIEAAFGVLFFPFAFLQLLLKRFSFKKILYYLGGFIVTLLPQAVFEFRHGFPMTRTLVAEFSGKASILGGNMSFTERLPERKLLFVNTLRDISHIPYELLSIVLLILAIYYFVSLADKKHKRDLVSEVSVSMFLFACLFYLLFPMQVKSWYVLGLSSVAAVFFSSIISSVYKRHFFGKILVFCLILFTFFHTLKAHSEYLGKNFLKPSDNPSNLTNEIKAVDWVYKEASGRGFRVYSYLPAIYDYPFQHVFWWYGTKTYGYQPEDIAYLPGQPEYISKSAKAWTKTRPTENGIPVFLIIQEDTEHSQRYQEWMGNFSKYCQEKEGKIIDSLRVVKLSSCPTDSKEAKQ